LTFAAINNKILGVERRKTKKKATARQSGGFQKIAEELKARIASGRLKPGQRLVELHLSRSFGTTRSKIREALKKLQQDGFVKITPNVGALVAEFSHKDIEHLYDLVSVIEGLAVRVITPFITAEEVNAIEHLVKKVERVADKPALFYERNNELHFLLITLSENEDLIKLADNLRYRIRCVNLQCVFSPGQITAAIKEHRKILDAIKERRAVKAEQLMRNHLLYAKSRLIKYLNKSL
jgi:DNA-binding GntR family transcriptional regulator